MKRGQSKSRLKKRIEESQRGKEKGEFLSLYPCLDFLEGPLKRAEIKILVLAHQRKI